MEFTKAYPIHMGAARIAADLGDGSERGEYVNQDYILNKLGRPLRAISLMYCYYPLDQGWPVRASIAHASDSVSFAWDYPYDDYFTYKGGLNGNLEEEPFCYMREIRAHGQDVSLTLTIDPNVDDSHLEAIGKDLSRFGRVFLRINHEATGDWFSFNKRCTYQEVADFFVRACKVIKKFAPNVLTITCAGGVEDPNDERMIMEDKFGQTIVAADIWSIDKYMSLHWGWPYDVAERGGNSHNRLKVDDVYDVAKKSFERFKYLCNGEVKPMTMGEFNADGDVTGPYDQAQMVQDFVDRLKRENADWLSSFNMYQFRDRGRLGLEIEDPNNSEVGIEQPLLHTYKKMIHTDWFLPEMTMGETEVSLPQTLRWGHSEDADGLAIPLHFESNPHFCEVVFEGDENYIMELNGKWFYKSPKARTIDLMPAFFEKPLTEATDLTLKIFAPPASGENDLSIPDGRDNCYFVCEKLPKVRILFEPVEL